MKLSLERSDSICQMYNLRHIRPRLRSLILAKNKYFLLLKVRYQLNSLQLKFTMFSFYGINRIMVLNNIAMLKT